MVGLIQTRVMLILWAGLFKKNTIFTKRKFMEEFRLIENGLQPHMKAQPYNIKNGFYDGK